MADEVMYVSAKELKVGGYVMIEGVPCKIVDIETSAPGKHGSAKMRITAIGIFDGQKKTMLKPSSGDAERPVIDKRKAQVISVTGTMAQLMDADTYETYDLQVPEDLRGSVKSGAEVEVIHTMGKRAMTRLLGGV